jgi:mercuric ion binding protein
MKISLLFAGLLLMMNLAFAQEKNKKTSFEVKGNCEMCKARIEKASLKVKGVKYASWDIPSHYLSLIIDERKCSEIDVKKAVAAVGHDTDVVKATDEAYQQLDPCCQYRHGDGGHKEYAPGHH